MMKIIDSRRSVAREVIEIEDFDVLEHIEGDTHLMRLLPLHPALPPLPALQALWRSVD
jgi:hypothetical protein